MCKLAIKVSLRPAELDSELKSQLEIRHLGTAASGSNLESQTPDTPLGAPDNHPSTQLLSRHACYLDMPGAAFKRRRGIDSVPILADVG